jgi:hypothetical protein
VVVGKLAQEWIGLPLPTDCSDLDLAAFVMKFVFVSEYCFQTCPDPQLTLQAMAVGRELRAAYAAGRPIDGPMAVDLRDKGESNEERIWQAMMGAIVGFAAPGIASVVEAMVYWMNAGMLKELSGKCALFRNDADLQRFLFDRLIAALERVPEPPILYRTALEGAQVGEAKIGEGEMVVVGLQSVVADAREDGDEQRPWRWIFGGEHGGETPGKPPHGCPARPAALDVILGIVGAILSAGILRRVGSTVVSFARPNNESADTASNS